MHAPSPTYRLKDLMQCQQALATLWGKVLMARSKVKLMRQAYESEKSLQQHGKDITDLCIIV